jgi:hypothetical protein
VRIKTCHSGWWLVVSRWKKECSVRTSVIQIVYRLKNELLIEGKFLEHFGLLTSGFRLLFFWSQLIEAQSLGNNNKNIGSECFE